jgi:lipopolysaccharide/colanic/teichoic acid biosynthesis glycosyltransferase
MGLSPGGHVFKRSIDVVVAVLMLLVCFPLLALCGLLIKLDSRGPILFRQARMGRDFTVFRLLKPRTMRAGEDGPAITLGADPRITLVGGWLRRWKVDELPQLWNVVRGEMSLVGPRPVIPELAWEFVSDYRDLLRMRPGLTDPATIQYCREVEILSRVSDPLSYFRTVVTPEKLRISRDYLLRATIRSDFQIMIKTGQALLFRSRSRALVPGLETLRRPASQVSTSQD